MLRDVAVATNFGTQFVITGFVGYNFGCMIASDTLFDCGGGFLGSLYFCPVVSIFLFYPHLISAVADWLSTILLHMVWS